MEKGQIPRRVVGFSYSFFHRSVSKESVCNVGVPVLIPGLGRSPGEGNGNPFQYSCVDNPMDEGTWQAIVHGVARVGHDLVTKPHHQNWGGQCRAAKPKGGAGT